METVGISIISKGEEKRRYLPLEIRLQMYDDVIELRKQGLNYIQIQKEIYEKYGKQISLSQICFWVNKRRHPLGKVNKFDYKPSPELAYVMGTILGDGNKYFNGENYYLRLSVKDYEFAEEYGKCLAKVLKKDKPYKPFWSEKEKKWIIEGYSILLFKFLNQPLEELKTYIEYSKDTVSAFLRALFDGEGSIYVKYHRRALRFYNTNEELLNYVKHLLEKYFGVNTTGPYLAIKSNEVKHFPNKRKYRTTKNCYYIYVRVNSLLNFYKYIRFTIKRKQQRLIEAINSNSPSFF